MHEATRIIIECCPTFFYRIYQLFSIHEVDKESKLFTHLHIRDGDRIEHTEVPDELLDGGMESEAHDGAASKILCRSPFNSDCRLVIYKLETRNL